MNEISQDYNWVLVGLSYLISVSGSFVALISMRQAIESPLENQRWLLALTGAIALGGVGIWSMHFVGMLALTLGDLLIRYDLLMTFLSLAIAIIVVYIGLFMIRHGMPGIGRLIGIGTIVGLGVTAMHYTGMLAMRLQADIVWSPTIIALSALIAITAATVALWLAANLTKLSHLIGSAFVMGLAVCGMHYTGMYAATFFLNPSKSAPGSMFLSNIYFAVAIFVVGGGALFMISMINIMLRTEADLYKMEA